MLRVDNDMKIFVFCPKDSVTGGAELLHQLVHVLNVNHKIASLIYFNPNTTTNEICNAQIPDEYKKYNINLATEIEDTSNNVIVLYEAIFDKIKNIQKAQTILWWLSVDNFFYCSVKYLSLIDYFKWNKSFALKILFYRLYKLLTGRNYFKGNISIKYLAKRNCLSTYQSEYAQNFLQNQHFKEMLPLKDFINDDFFNENIIYDKEDLILYNPKKGIEFTNKIIKRFPSLNWLPLENMSRKEMIEKLRKAKVYIDFGFHPGKDRIPREAVMSKVCIITGFDGSAGFFEDVPIYNQYKIEKTDSNIVYIGKLIEKILENHEEHIKNFEFYQERTRKEKDEFIQQVADIFDIKNANRETI
ncbi:MAG: hypothetical protein H6Q14_1357 [Bacteroidetes bacterium]|nr:hypothetical protein [Bacteroidota bacterium]